MKTISLLFAVFLLPSCGPSVRDEAIYRLELSLYDTWAHQQSEILRTFINAYCECNKETKTFLTKDCSNAADYVLTVESRHKWHMAMTFYNAGLSDNRPPENPPKFPDLTCPLPADVEESK